MSYQAEHAPSDSSVVLQVDSSGGNRNFALPRIAVALALYHLLWRIWLVN